MTRPVGATRIAAAAGALALVGCGSSSTPATLAATDAGDSPSFEVPLPTRVVITVGREWTCGLRAGAAQCWGDNSFGRLHRSAAGASQSAPGVVDGPAGRFTEVRAGASATCAIRDGQAFCWGGGEEWGILGGSTGPRGVAVPLADVEEVAVGAQFACAREAGGVRCWGRNEYGQLTSDYATGAAFASAPVALPSLAGTRHLALGDQHGCALDAGGAVRCWGRNDFRQAGPDTGELCDGKPCVKAPRRVPGLERIVQLSLGSTHSCALDADARVWCWGDASTGQLGGPGVETTCREDGGGPEYPCTDIPQLALGGAQQVSAGTGVTCAVSNGDVGCWGANDFGQLGRSAAATKAPPGRVEIAPATPLSGAVQVATRYRHGCALMKDESLYCWGTSTAGALGVGASRAPRAVRVPW